MINVSESCDIAKTGHKGSCDNHEALFVSSTCCHCVICTAKLRMNCPVFTTLMIIGQQQCVNKLSCAKLAMCLRKSVITLG